MKLRCVAIDDEPFGLNILEDDLSQIPFVELVGKFTNPLAAVGLLERGEVDLIFLDIEMPYLSGITFLQGLADPPMVVFVTAYEQYALKGFELDAIDYLLKPFSSERLLKACTKAYEIASQRKKQDTGGSADSFFFIRSEYREVKILNRDILYIEGLKDYVKIFMQSSPSRPLLTRMNVKAIEHRLDTSLFCRVHQSYIVPLHRITSFRKTKLLLGDIEIPVGKRYVSDFLKRYGKGSP